MPIYLLSCSSLEMLCGPDGELPEKLRNLEPRLIEHVSNEIMDRDPNVRWDDIGTVRCFSAVYIIIPVAPGVSHHKLLMCSWSGAC